MLARGAAGAPEARARGQGAGAAAGASPRGGEGGQGGRSPGFGPLRQLDLQLVQPMRGFGTHCDLDMEVLTYVVEGRLAHRDATGREATLLPGGIQCVTGGTGAYHSESNPAHAAPLRQVRLHVLPRGKCLEPKYGASQAFRRGCPAHKEGIGDHALERCRRSLRPHAQLEAQVDLRQELHGFREQFEHGGRAVEGRGFTEHQWMTL